MGEVPEGALIGKGEGHFGMKFRIFYWESVGVFWEGKMSCRNGQPFTAGSSDSFFLGTFLETPRDRKRKKKIWGFYLMCGGSHDEGGDIL